MPVALGIEVIENETAEKTVFGILDERANLLGRAREECGEAGRLDAYIFLVLSADIGDGFVVEGFAEAVGVIAIVGVEGVGERVALGLEHQAVAVALVQGLIDGSGGGVCWDSRRRRGGSSSFSRDFLFSEALYSLSLDLYSLRSA